MTETNYNVSWKSDTQRTRKEATFVSITLAEEWYNEKLEDGKKPELWVEEITVIRKKLK